MQWAYGIYSGAVEKLVDFVEAARRIIGNLSALQVILNHIKTQMPENYSFPPKKWEDIPDEILKKLMAFTPPILTEEQWKTKTPESWKILYGYVTKPPGSNYYVQLSDEYFKKTLGSTADPQPGDIPAILNLRDSLIRQMAILKAGGAPIGDGTPYDTISKVLETINKEFPVNTYPIPVPDPNNPADPKKDLVPGKNWNVEFGGIPKTDGSGGYTFDFDTIKQKYPSAKDEIIKWINSGQGQNNTTNDTLDKALNANQRLSDDMSKDLQAKNQQLTQIEELLIQLGDTLNKILSGMAQKIARG